MMYCEILLVLLLKIEQNSANIAANGASFVYYGVCPVPSDSHEAKVLIPYTRGVLDAMGVSHGASHAEIMMTPDGPCLVEMNCRTNGGDGIWRPLVSLLSDIKYPYPHLSLSTYLPLFYSSRCTRLGL